MVLALSIALSAGGVAAARTPARAEKIAVHAIRAAIQEARLHMNAAGWAAAERVLKGLRQQLALDPQADAMRVKLEFVLWDLRLGNTAAARRDLDALEASL